MRDRVLIFTGLALFMTLVTYPLWRGILLGSSTAEPKLSTVSGEKSCVASRDYMRQSHMELLKEWRDGKVREGRRHYRSREGIQYNVSLSGTCLTQCHGSAEEFCIRCHAYAGVPALDCWHCHTSPPKGAPVASGGIVR